MAREETRILQSTSAEDGTRVRQTAPRSPSDPRGRVPGPPLPLGDPHNFGRRVSARGDWLHKPRTVYWEWLTLSAASPLRRALASGAAARGAPDLFSFLPDLAFTPARPRADGRRGGAVERLALRPLGPGRRRELAAAFGRSLALWSWLGVADLHWENLALGEDEAGRLVFTPLDVEMILDDLALPTETKLLPDPDPEVADECRHACGARRLLPFLGKPVGGAALAAMARGYREALALLEEQRAAIARVLDGLPGVREAPIRVCLRGTGDYVRARTEPVWPPLLDGEAEQLARGDVPYFFRLVGRPGIRFYAEPTLEGTRCLPRAGDVPRLEPLLLPSRGLRSARRARLRDEGLFTLLGAFDHEGLSGTFRDGDLALEVRPRTLVAHLPGGEELRVGRDLRAFVGSVYLPCGCGEVRTPLVPPVTRCRPRRARPRHP